MILMEAGVSQLPVWFQVRPAVTADTPEETEYTPAPVWTALKQPAVRFINY